MSLSVLNRVTIYEIDGEETKGLTSPALTVESHWNRHQMVVLTVGKRKVTVLGRDLEAAIQNAMNAGRS